VACCPWGSRELGQPRVEEGGATKPAGEEGGSTFSCRRLLPYRLALRCHRGPSAPNRAQGSEGSNPLSRLSALGAVGGGELDDTGKRCQRQPMRGEGPTTTDNRRWRLPPVSTSPEMREEDGELRWGSPKPRRRYLYSAPWMGRGMARLAGSHRGKEE
jgi:hypothetical protein